MKIKLSLLALVMGTMAVMSQAQDRLTDKVVVNLPNDVTMNDQVIPAGKYELRQLSNPAGGANVVFVTEEGAEKFHAAVTTIPVVANNTPDATRVILRRVGRNFYIDKIWLAGRDYGYEFELPGYAKLLMERKNEPATLRLDYRSASTAAAAPKEPARAPEPAPVAVAPAPPPEPPKEIAQAAPPPPPPAPQAAPAPAPEPAPAPPAQTQPLPQSLPATASALFGVLIFGLSCLAGSAALRWWRSAA